MLLLVSLEAGFRRGKCRLGNRNHESRKLERRIVEWGEENDEEDWVVDRDRLNFVAVKNLEIRRKGRRLGRGEGEGRGKWRERGGGSAAEISEGLEKLFDTI